jgi:glycosyltransferase involved in cell wall biosynthesis
MAATHDELVSVVIASYNMGHYLGQAVQSVLAQSYQDVEVQIVDDGSTDNTAEVVRRWASDPRVRVHTQPNAGQARAKNTGVALSRGRFVAFLDADDLWLPGKLERQMELFRGRPEVGVVYSEYQVMDGDGRLLEKGPTPMRRGWVSGELLIENFVCYSAGVVRRECLERCGAFDETLGMGIDYDLWLRLSAHYQFDFVPEPTVRYRIWAGQMSKNYKKRYQSAIRIMESFLTNNPGIVDGGVVRQAWAHTYVGRGDITLWQEANRRAAFRDYLRALRRVPWYWRAWRSMLRSLITTRAP